MCVLLLVLITLSAIPPVQMGVRECKVDLRGAGSSSECFRLDNACWCWLNLLSGNSIDDV